MLIADPYLYIETNFCLNVNIFHSVKATISNSIDKHYLDGYFSLEF